MQFTVPTGFRNIIIHDQIFRAVHLNQEVEDLIQVPEAPFPEEVILWVARGLVAYSVVVPTTRRAHVFSGEDHLKTHDDVLSWKSSVHYWPFIRREIHWPLVDPLTNGL